MRAVRFVGTIGLVMLAAGPAFAADALAPTVDVPVVMDSPLYTWSGPYVGGFVGYNFANMDQSGGADFDGEGLVGGVYAGYNLQTDQLVYGIEADIGGGSVDAGGYNAAIGVPLSSDQSVFGSVRGRVGVAADPFLVFATGGLAVSNQELSRPGASDENTHFGYTVGAGIEAQVTDNVTSRLEYRYSDFGSEDYKLGDVTVSSGFDEHSIRAGLALKF